MPDLPTTTTERLLAVAAHIESHPDEWVQSVWTGSNVGRPDDEKGRGECGTVACIAGWAVRFTPKDFPLDTTWSVAGAEALGLHQHLADAIFHSDYAPADVASELRLLARLPEPRTLDAAIVAGLDMTGADLQGVDLTEVHDLSALGDAFLDDARVRPSAVAPPGWLNTGGSLCRDEPVEVPV